MKIGIIGGGIGGLMTAYRLQEKSENIEVYIFEKGNALEDRACPIINKKTDGCVHCAKCAIMEGLAGAGAFSDGKYNITTEFGGWLQDIRKPEEVIEYIEEVDKVLIRFGATEERFVPNNDLKKLCLQNDLHMLQSQCKHLGTDANYNTMLALINYLQSKGNIHVFTNCAVLDVVKDKTGLLVKCNNGDNYPVDEVVFAVGRVGSGFFSDWCHRNGVPQENNQVDIGVRVELPSMVWEDFEKKIYEPKILYRSQKYGDITRMFCFNGRGEVVTENTDGVLTVNGHAYKAEDKKTKNTNFALLSTIKFTKPFNEPIEYAKHIAKLANMISGGSVLVQRLGDLERGRRTDDSRLRKSTVQPTLRGAVPGDLSLCIPKRQLDNIVETLHVLNKVAPGTSNPDTLLYGIECKYYSARPKADKNFEIEGMPGVYAVGDGAGFTRSLAQAGAQGMMVADSIITGI